MNNLKEHFKLKSGVDWKCFSFIHPILFLIVADMNLWLYEAGYQMTITSMVRPFNDGISKSTTHATGRAIDIRTREIPDIVWNEFITYFNEKYEDKAAYSRTFQKPLLCWRHGNLQNDHIHVQIHKRYELKP